MKITQKSLFIFLFSLVFLAFQACKSDDIVDNPDPPLPPEFDTTFPEGLNVPLLAPVLPHIYINTDTGEGITSKTDYLNADLIIDGKTIYDNFEGRTKIRGRGNTSWGFPKKPYRLKLDSAAELLGLPAYKNWVLLAEYLDGSMLYNSVPFATAHLLGIPYTNHIVPVQISINGEYKGVYSFTEHKEVGANRIDIGNDGLLLEMDVYYDEDWKFMSSEYELPVMVQFPKDDDMNQGKLESIISDFEAFETLLSSADFPENDYHKLFDVPAYINYMIVYELTQNREINHPKSTYLNKKKDGKYNMGIIWDFDWGFGYGFNGIHYDMGTVNEPILIDNLKGGIFFGEFLKDPRVRDLFAERWQWFRSNKYQQLRQYVIAYAETTRHGYDNDHAVWGPRNSSGNLDTDLQRLLDWLDARADYIDFYVDELVNP